MRQDASRDPNRTTVSRQHTLSVTANGIPVSKPRLHSSHILESKKDLTMQRGRQFAQDVRSDTTINRTFVFLFSCLFRRGIFQVLYKEYNHNWTRKGPWVKYTHTSFRIYVNQAEYTKTDVKWAENKKHLWHTRQIYTRSLLRDRTERERVQARVLG